jgi:putative ABC transport system ATP-binding protein
MDLDGEIDQFRFHWMEQNDYHKRIICYNVLQLNSIWYSIFSTFLDDFYSASQHNLLSDKNSILILKKTDILGNIQGIRCSFTKIMALILSIDKLSKIYQKGAVEIPALRDVGFELPRGSYLSIVGKSGSGKSTLLNLVGGLDRPTSGSIQFNGKDLGKMSRYQLALHRRNSVGMIFQSFNLLPRRTALENIILPLTFAGLPRRKRKDRAKELLEQVGLGERISHFPSELSGGEAQRVAIARAMANEPRMILADEPTGNLDSSTAGEIIDLLVSLNKDKGLSILMVTHDKETAEMVSDSMITLKDGSII